MCYDSLRDIRHDRVRLLYRLTVAGLVTADRLSRRGRAENLVAAEVGASDTFVVG